MDRPDNPVVQVCSATGGFLGSGFFIAQRTVVTCAHVLEKCGDDVLVRWKEQEFAGTVLVRDPPGRAGGRYYPAPDVAFIGVQTLDNPWPVLETTPLGRDVESVFVEGFSAVNPTGGVAPERRDVRVIGESGPYRLLSDDHIVPGMSGSPIMVLAGDAGIRGMLKSGRLAQGNSAYMVPAPEIQASFRRHQRLLKAHMRDLPPLIRPRPGEPLHDLLVAQREAAQRYPYRVATLTQREPPPLSDVYVEQRVDQDVRREAISPVMMLRRHRNALIVGGPGGGKSTLVQQLVAASAGWWLSGAGSRADEEPPLGRVVAVRVGAQDLLTGDAWYETLAGAVTNDLALWLDVALTETIFRQPPVPGAEWLILVDGLDEVLGREARRKVIDRLRFRVVRYGETTRFVATSRRLADREFEFLRSSLAAAQRTERLGEYHLRPFDWPAVQTFAHNWFRPAGGEQSPVEPADYLNAITTAGLTPLVEVPLLATISAIVYEERPDNPLPLDRAGLYETFVLVLFTLRIQRLGARAALREQLAGIGPEAETLGERMFGDRLDCLSFLAEQLLRSGRRSGEALRTWLTERYRRLPLGVTAEHMRGLLLDTGLVAEHGDDLVFIHQSFTEYLASRRLAAEFDPDAWLVQVRRTGPDSLGLFTLAAWAREPGNDPGPVVAALIGPGERGEFPHLAEVAALIQDGGVMAADGGGKIIELAETAVRQVRDRDDAVLPAINQVLRAIRQRTRDAAKVVRVAVDRSLSVSKRAEAARVLVTSESAADHETGLAQLLRIAYEERHSDEDRLRALHVIVESGPPFERRHALQHLAQSAETNPDDDVRMLALHLLARSGEGGAGAAALMRRSLDPHRSLDQRLRASDLIVPYLGALGPAMPPPADLGVADLAERAWHPPVLPGRDPESLSHYAGNLRDSIWFFLGVQRRYLERYARVRVVPAHERALTIVLSGRTRRDETAWQAMLVLTGDPRERPERRVAELVLVERYVPDWSGRVRDVLLAWVRDEREGTALRRTALRELLTRLTPERTRELAADSGLPVRLRAAAAFALAGTQRHEDEARRLLVAISRDRRHPLRARLACRLRLAILPLVARLSAWETRRAQRR